MSARGWLLAGGAAFAALLAAGAAASSSTPPTAPPATPPPGGGSPNVPPVPPGTQPPPPPPGWRRLTRPVTPELTAKAVEVLHSPAPLGSMTPFVASTGETFGAFVTLHPKGGRLVRAVEIWEPIGGTVPPATPVPPTSPAPPPSVPPSGAGTGASALRSQIPEQAGQSRDAAILSLLLGGHMLPIRWALVPVDAETGRLQVFVTSDAIALGTASDFVRVNISILTATLLADKGGALLCTSKISDAAWRAANVVLLPSPQSAAGPPQMNSTTAMYNHTSRIEKERGGRGGLVRTVGKDFVLSNAMRASQSCIYGWHGGPLATRQSPGGAPIIQSLAVNPHEASYTDYSQQTQLVRRDCLLDGQKRDLAEILTDPLLASLASYEGKLKFLRHPAVPPP